MYGDFLLSSRRHLLLGDETTPLSQLRRHLWLIESIAKHCCRCWPAAMTVLTAASRPLFDAAHGQSVLIIFWSFEDSFMSDNPVPFRRR